MIYEKPTLLQRLTPLAKGFDAVCAFVSSDIGTETVEKLHEAGVKLILLRCAGFNNVDLEKAQEYGIKVMRGSGLLSGSSCRTCDGTGTWSNKKTA